MRYATKVFPASVAIALLAGCASMSEKPDQADVPEIANQNVRFAQVSDEPIVLGAPFKVGTVNYVPQDAPTYDDVGYASYTDSEAGQRQTANGEVFNAAGATAAHKTLPMPSYVEVTALDTGRTIVVRINDRGPMANDRIIDLSEGAARQLGIIGQPVTGVRVRRVNPPEQERAVLRQGLTAAERIETPEPLLKVLRDRLAKLPRPTGFARSTSPATAAAGVKARAAQYTSDDGFIREGEGAAPVATAPRPAKAISAKSGGYIVQIGAFSSRARAEAFARSSHASVSGARANGVYRVYFGPYENEAEAQKGLARARQSGNPQARISVN